MMTDKHIEQWATYLIEELPKYKHLAGTLDESIYDIIVEMYKKGYQDGYESNANLYEKKGKE